MWAIGRAWLVLAAAAALVVAPPRSVAAADGAGWIEGRSTYYEGAQQVSIATERVFDDTRTEAAAACI
jgi:hypothetical protein